MITRLIWTIWTPTSAVRFRLINLITHSLQIPSVGARSLNELLRLGHMIGYRASNHSNGHQVTSPIYIICYDWKLFLCRPLASSTRVYPWLIEDRFFHVRYVKNLFDIACKFSYLYNYLLKQFSVIFGSFLLRIFAQIRNKETFFDLPFLVI